MTADRLTINRKIESPQGNGPRALAARYPGYAIVGSRDGWFHRVEATRTIFIAVNWDSLVNSVRKHLAANNLPVPLNLNAEMEDQWCRETGDPNCGAPVDQAAVARAMSLQTKAFRFLQTMWRWVRSGEGFVPQEEAERRANLCVNCPKHGVINCSSSCKFTSLINIVMPLFGARKTTVDDRLKDCLVCGCLLKAATHVPLIVMEYPELAQDWPADYPCWHKPSE